MPRSVRLASVSFRSRETPDENVAAAESLIDSAGAQRADLIVFPEAFAHHRTGVCPADAAEPLPGGLVGHLAQRAAGFEMCSVIPCYERDGAHVFNTAAVFERDGRLVGRYRKTHPTQPELDEGILPGSELPVFELSLGRIAVAICFDFWFPEVGLVYAMKGAELICLADMKTGPSVYDIMLRLKGTAAITQTYVMQAQFSDDPPYAPYAGRYLTGHGCVVGPDGIVLADTGHRPGLAVATVDLDEPRLTRDAGYYGERVNFKAALNNFRRPELYAELAAPRRDGEYVDSRLKAALDKLAAQDGRAPYPGTPFCPDSSRDHPLFFPPVSTGQGDT
jgi:predicted amidohydrolase